MTYANLFEFDFDITHYACLILLIQLRATKIDIVWFLQSLILRKSGQFAEIYSRRNKIFVGMLIILVFSKPGIQNMWEREISVCKVVVPIQVVLVKNVYFLYPKF